jgi:hypothetical protein
MSDETPFAGTELPQTIVTSIQGRVLNEQQQPLQGATVTAGGKTITTDADGSFLLENISVLDDAAMVSVEKSGYFKGYRTLMVRKDQLQYIRVQLLLKNQTTINGGTGDIIPFPEGTLTFPANGTLTASNQYYTGDLTVRSIYIDPQGSTAADQMPGDLRGIDENNRQVGLRAFSMIVFTMEDGSGAPLHPDPAKPVGFEIMIPSELAGAAPQQIPLWYFDSVSGFWKQEGQATRQGGDYTGTAKHSGYWLCATAYPLITLTAGLVDTSNAGIPNLRVTLMDKTDFFPTYGFSSGDGAYFGKVPANSPLILTVTDNCGDVLRQLEIGPFNTTTRADDITISAPASNTLTIKGKATDCDSFNVVKGKAMIQVDGQNYATSITLGNFNTTIIRCASGPVNAIITATDDRTGKTSSITMDVNTGTITPAIKVCD